MTFKWAARVCFDCTGRSQAHVSLPILDLSGTGNACLGLSCLKRAGILHMAQFLCVKSRCV